MAGLADFRAQHPEYNDMPDGMLADSLYKKFYSDIPRADFDAKLGLSSPPPAPGSAQAAVGSPGPASQGFFGGIADAAGGMYNQILGGLQKTSPIVNPQYVPLGEPVASESASGYGYLGKNGQPGGQFDPNKHVILRDPATGKMMIYARSAATDEGVLPSVGRILGVGALAPAAAPIATAGAANRAVKLLQDYKNLNIRPNLPVIAQERGIATVGNIIRDTPVVGLTVRKPAEQMLQQTGQAATNLAGKYGPAASPAAAGRALQAGVEGFADSGTAAPAALNVKTVPTRAVGFQQKANALYDQIGIAPDTHVALDNTAKALEGVGGRFTSAPELGKTLVDPKFASWLDKLQKAGTLTWGEMREFRSYVGRMLSRPQIVSDIPRADLERLYGGLSQDLGTAAQAAGRFKQFSLADRYYRVGLDRINNSLKSVFQAPSPEAAYERVLQAAMARGSRADIQKLQALRRSMQPEEWQSVASTLVNRMGTQNPGAVDLLAEGVNFSPATFATNFGKLSEDAKGVIFDAAGNGALRKELDALARVATSQKNAERLANPSGSGRYAITGGIGAGLVAAPVKTLLVMAGEAGLGAAMMSPTVVRWLVQSARVRTPAEWAAHVGRLRAIAELEPTLSQPLRAFADRLQAGGGSDQGSPAGR